MRKSVLELLDPDLLAAVGAGSEAAAVPARAQVFAPSDPGYTRDRTRHGRAANRCSRSWPRTDTSPKRPRAPSFPQARRRRPGSSATASR